MAVRKKKRVASKRSVPANGPKAKRELAAKRASKLRKVRTLARAATASAKRTGKSTALAAYRKCKIDELKSELEKEKTSKARPVGTIGAFSQTLRDRAAAKDEIAVRKANARKEIRKLEDDIGNLKIKLSAAKARLRTR
jgi:hypothetical protein